MNKSIITKIFWITFAWMLVSVANFFMGYSILLEFNCDLQGKDPIIPFYASLITGLVAGLTGGTVMVVLWEKWLRTKPYGWTLINIFISYILVFIVVAVPTGLFYQINFLNLPISDLRVWNEMFSSLSNATTLVPFFFWLVTVIFTMIALQVNDKFGPGIFREFLLGRYFQPKREERIFMFLDLRSSTSIAEKLGEEKYFNFLREVYQEITPAILNHSGEIYQYVGDEIVVSWKPHLGYDNFNCIECFLDIQKALREKANYYMSKYEIEPVFKAGIHSGHVMAGEIGVVKRDIAFSGDVLNTTSRIQEKCNELGVELLISKKTTEDLKRVGDKYTLTEIGAIHLKGKQEEVTLYTI